MRLSLIRLAPGLFILKLSHHITGMSSLFSCYHVCSRRDEVRIVDGSYSSIASKGDIIANHSIHLSSVFHVPKFSLKCLSISQSLNLLIAVLPLFFLIVSIG